MRVPIINREISWLSFNERVLQEAEDPDVPLLERLRFLGIFSNNQDEFFRVRIATIRRMVLFEDEAKRDLGTSPVKLLEVLQKKVISLGKRFDAAYDHLLKRLREEGIYVLNEEQLTPEQGRYVEEYFHDKVRLRTYPIMLSRLKKIPNLNDSSIYLAVRFFKNGDDEKNYNYSLLELPVGPIPRYIVLPKQDNNNYIIYLDDVLRYNLKKIYQIYDFDTIEAYTIKFTRDAELDIDNDVSDSFLTAVEESLKKRKTGDPLRFVYDNQMPETFLKYLISKFNIKEVDSVLSGGRYHNSKDLMGFPFLNRPDLWYVKQETIPHPDLYKVKSILDTIAKKDVMLFYPYHSFDYFLDMIREAAIDPRVSHIRINIYRVAKDSNVIKSLITAVRNGKYVTVLIELRARFDEEANIYWANLLKEEGVRVIPGVTGLKVHSKLCLITRRENGKKMYYGAIGTGNFHEGTAKIYTDFQLLTCNQSITREARDVFTFFERNYVIPTQQKLITAPFNLRKRIYALINREIRNARAGDKAEIKLKLNNLVDTEMISKLYMASKAGVKIKLLVRGICSLIPGIPGKSENIKAISLVDRYLEHGRIFIFHNNGNDEVYIGSADLMTRNIDYRIEVLCPILDSTIKKQIKDVFNIQWNGNVKIREFDKELTNSYRKRKPGQQIVRAQEETRKYYLDFFESKISKK